MPITVSGGAAQTPASQAFSVLKTRVVRYIHGPSDSEMLTVAGEEINDAIRELNTREWYWGLTYDDTALVAGTRAYAVENNCKAARSMALLDSSNNVQGLVTYYDPKTFELMFNSVGTSGSPCGYTLYNRTDVAQFEFDVAPNAAFVSSYPTVRFRYFARIPVLSGDSDTAPVPSEVEPWIVWRARWGVAMQYDEQKASIAGQKAAQLWNALVRNSNEHHFHEFS